jgi:flagellar hook-associated protein 2
MASGLPPNIVEQIMEAERIPIKQMEAKKAKDEDKLKLLSELTEKVTKIPKAVDDLVGVKGFKNSKLTSGDDKIVTGVIDPEKAVPGNWQIEVLQLAQKAGAKSTGFPDKNKTLAGAGYLKFKTAKGEREIYISRDESTLEGIANAINRSQSGLTAQVIESGKNNSEKFHLLVTGIEPGKDNNIEFPTVYLLDGEEDFEFEQTIKGQNAKIKLDGFEMELPDNIAQDVIPGVSLEIKQTNRDHPITIHVKEDYEVISGKIKEFVDAYNEALGWIQNQAKLQKDKSGRERLGPFGGDSIIRSVENKLRQIILQPQQDTDSSIKRVSELGIEFNRNGTLNFSQDKFNKVLNSKPQEVVKFLRGNLFSTGFIPNVKNAIRSLTHESTGPLGNRKRGIQERIKQIDERIERKEAQLVKKEDSLRKKFSELETKMSKLQAQGASFNAMQLSGSKGGQGG